MNTKENFIELLADIKKPIQLSDFLELLKNNGLKEYADQILEYNNLYSLRSDSVLYIDDILRVENDLYVYDCDGVKDIFESKSDGSYIYSFTEPGMKIYKPEKTDKQAIDLNVKIDPDDENYFYIGILLL